MAKRRYISNIPKSALSYREAWDEMMESKVVLYDSDLFTSEADFKRTLLRREADIALRKGTKPRFTEKFLNQLIGANLDKFESRHVRKSTGRLTMEELEIAEQRVKEVKAKLVEVKKEELRVLIAERSAKLKEASRIVREDFRNKSARLRVELKKLEASSRPKRSRKKKMEDVA